VENTNQHLPERDPGAAELTHTSLHRLRRISKLGRARGREGLAWRQQLERQRNMRYCSRPLALPYCVKDDSDGGTHRGIEDVELGRTAGAVLLPPLPPPCRRRSSPAALLRAPVDVPQRRPAARVAKLARRVSAVREACGPGAASRTAVAGAAAPLLLLLSPAAAAPPRGPKTAPKIRRPGLLPQPPSGRALGNGEDQGRSKIRNEIRG
jgi:hypothetical protein